MGFRNIMPSLPVEWGLGLALVSVIGNISPSHSLELAQPEQRATNIRELKIFNIENFNIVIVTFFEFNITWQYTPKYYLQFYQSVSFSP